MSIISLNQKKKQLELKAFEFQNELAFNYFDKLPSAERDKYLLKALHIGIVALMEDRIAAFLSKTSNELGTELESLKLIYDMQQEVFFKTAQKGADAERTIANFLSNLFESKGLEDSVALTGNASGALEKNKTGDIVCDINGDFGKRIVVECKFDKSIRLGEFDKTNISNRKSDTIFSQLIESDVNREAKMAIVVLDVSVVDSVVLREVGNVRYYEPLGFIAIVDSQRGDFSNLSIAYMLARDMILKSSPKSFDGELLNAIVSKILADVTRNLSIKKAILSNIQNNKNILETLENNFLSMEFNLKYLSMFLKKGSLDKSELLEFYTADEIRDRFKVIQGEIKNI